MAIHLLWPAHGPITQNFGENPSFYAQWGYPGHNGIDLGLPNGTPIVAANAGVIDRVAFEAGGYGNYVKIRHSDGNTTYYTYYCHLMHANVSAGQKVDAGQVIAHSNNTGASTGPHLHFGFRIMGHNPSFKGYMDPMPYMTFSIPTDPHVHPGPDEGGVPTEPGDPVTPPVQPPTGPTQPVPPTEPTEPAPPEAFPGAIELPKEVDFEVTNDTLNVRSGPGINYPLIGQLSGGDVIHGKRMYSPGVWIEFEEGKWCAISFAGIQYLKLILKAKKAPSSSTRRRKPE
jgi:hypothetical protein